MKYFKEITEIQFVQVHFLINAINMKHDKMHAHFLVFTWNHS